jgi:hypothetical protein
MYNLNFHLLPFNHASSSTKQCCCTLKDWDLYNRNLTYPNNRRHRRCCSLCQCRCHLFRTVCITHKREQVHTNFSLHRKLKQWIQPAFGWKYWHCACNVHGHNTHFKIILQKMYLYYLLKIYAKQITTT